MSLTLRKFAPHKTFPLAMGILSLSAALALEILGEIWPLVYLPALGLGLSSVAVVYEVVDDLRQGKFGSDLLAVLAIFVSLALGQYIAGLVIVVMVSGGEILEELATIRASSVLAALAKRMPQQAQRRLPDGTIKTIPSSELTIDDIIIVAPHGICPTDGVVIEGYGMMDEAYLTGEPTLIAKAPGAMVLSGAINGDAALAIKVLKPAADSRFAQIVSVIQNTSQLQIPLRRLGDRLGAAFTPLALGSACLAWYLSGDPTRFLAVLVVATPCPLIIAIPVAILGAISFAARRGILIRQASALEVLPKCSTLILDKTGTLTFGTPELTEVRCFLPMSERELLTLVGSMEQYSRHPLGRAILDRVKTESVPLTAVSQVRELPGSGLQGIIGSKTIQIVGRKQLPEASLDLIQTGTRGLECFVMVDQQLAAHLVFRDTPRPDSKPFIRHLGPNHSFTKVMLVSGDRGSEVQYMAKALGIEHVHAQVSPEGKLEIVKEESQNAQVAFIGDGINDAPALVAASVGIAFGEGSEVTSSAADVVVLTPSLRAVDELLHLSFFTRQVILQSALGGMALSMVGIIIASMGLLPPTYGALFQEVIDLAAVANALRVSFIQGRLSDI